MAKDANAPRKASAKLICNEIRSLKIGAGILIKSTRAYKRPSAPDGYRQTDVAQKAHITQNDVSRLENGTYIPDDPQLADALTAAGFVLTHKGGKALLALMKFIRDHESALSHLESEQPT